MQFVVAIEPGNQKTAWGVVVPDLPGCFSAGDGLDSALANAVEAIELHVSTLIDLGQPMPVIRAVDAHFANPDYTGLTWGVVDVPVERAWW